MLLCCVLQRIQWTSLTPAPVPGSTTIDGPELQSEFIVRRKPCKLSNGNTYVDAASSSGTYITKATVMSYELQLGRTGVRVVLG